MPLPVALNLEGLGPAEIVQAEGERVVLRSSAPRPPGAPLTGNREGEARPYRMKVRGCRKIEDERGAAYRIEARLIDPTKEQRALLGV